jgi:hypothetical protein
VSLVINLGLVLGGEWDMATADIAAVPAALTGGEILKVIIESAVRNAELAVLQALSWSARPVGAPPPRPRDCRLCPRPFRPGNVSDLVGPDRARGGMGKARQRQPTDRRY